MGLSAARRPCLLGLAHVWLWVAPRTPKISRGADTPLRAQRGAEAQAPASAKAADPAASIPARRERDSDSDLFVLLYLLWPYFLWLYLLTRREHDSDLFVLLLAETARGAKEVGDCPCVRDLGEREGGSSRPS